MTTTFLTTTDRPYTWADLDALQVAVHPLKQALIEARANAEAAYREYDALVDLWADGALVGREAVDRAQAAYEAAEETAREAYYAWNTEQARLLDSNEYTCEAGVMEMFPAAGDDSEIPF